MPPPSSSSTDELQALRAELAALKGELRVATVERDLLREKLKAYHRQLFASGSEVCGAEQHDLSLDEAEALATGCEPAQETETEHGVEVGAYERKKRGSKPLDSMLPREIGAEISEHALPLYQIAALLHRFGGDISRDTLAASVVRVGMAVQPLINLMRDHLLEADIVYGDETRVHVLKEPGRAAQRKSYMWAQMNGTGSPVRMFSYSPTPSAAQAAALYAGIKIGAVLMSDDYERYNEIARTNQRCTSDVGHIIPS